MGMKTYRRASASVHPGAAAGRRPADIDAERDQQLRAVDTVCAYIPEGDDRDTVLAVLFQPPYKTPPDGKPRTREKVLRFNGIEAGDEDAATNGGTS